MKYAHIERERRFLLHQVPAGLQPIYWQITDRYIINTRLRLRRMQRSNGTETIYKLGQKYKDAAHGDDARVMTNIYLNPAEFEILRQLDARELSKDRYGLDRYAIDIFHGQLEGLILAELEATQAEVVIAPPFAFADVTANPLFEGGNLASMSSADLQPLLNPLFAT